MIPPLISAYLERALPAAGPVPRSVRITQAGQMWKEPGAAPRRFTAVQHLAVERVAFAWRARFPIVWPFAIKVVDAYADGEGTLDVRLLGRTVQRERGPEMAVGEAMRYLAELPLVPHAMAHNGELGWRQLDDGQVEVTTVVGQETIAVVLELDETGDIVRASAAGRPGMRGDVTVRMPWGGEFSDYRELGRMRMPTRAEVYWDYPEGRHVYWRGEILTALALTAPFVPGR